MSDNIPTATSSQIQAAVDTLAQSVAALTKQEVAVVLPFAEQFGPAAARWGVQLAAAQQAKDQATIDRLNNDFTAITDVVVEQAAEYGIDVQAATEKGLFAVVGTVAQAAKFFV